jgi:uncharacterized protein YbjT (DUF2867 family)
LIIGCGCRGRSLAGELRARGHAVRGTTRGPARLPEIRATGVEAVLGDPDRIATIAPAFDHVSIVCVLLGSVVGAPDRVRALHGPRLEMLLARMLDTTVRGVVYEVAGSVDSDLLRAGSEIVRDVCVGSRIPYELLDVDPIVHQAWLMAASGAVDRMLGAA